MAAMITDPVCESAPVPDQLGTSLKTRLQKMNWAHGGGQYGLSRTGQNVIYLGDLTEEGCIHQFSAINRNRSKYLMQEEIQ